MADFPTALTGAADNVTDVLAKHLNNLETKVGVDSSAVTNSMDYLSKANPDSFLINGTIVVTVTNNDLNVFIKAMDGNDPSATEPVYVRIGNVVRSITAALGHTLVDGTDWFDSGGTRFAAKLRPYFVYLKYNATDGVTIGFSPIPYGRLYSDFSATSTNEKYCAFNVITNAAAGDNCVNIGRFEATLSAGAGYTWTVPTFTTKNLIQRPVYDTGEWYTWLPTYTASASMTYTSTTVCKYRIDGRKMSIVMNISGTTGGTASTTILATLPMNYITVSQGACQLYDAGIASRIAFFSLTGSSQIQFLTNSVANWGLGASREAYVATFYEI